MEAAWLLSNPKKFVLLEKAKIQEYLAVLADHKTEFPLPLQVKLTERLAVDQLEAITRLPEVSEACERIKQWAESILPWSAPNHRSPELLEPSCPCFQPVLEAILELARCDQDGTDGSEDETDLLLSEAIAAQALCEVSVHVLC